MNILAEGLIGVNIVNKKTNVKLSLGAGCRLLSVTIGF